MKRITRGLGAAASAALLCGTAGAASAQSSFSLSDTYVKAFGGATWPSSDDENLRRNGEKIGRVDLDYDTGYVLGAAVGWNATPNVGLEFEYAYRRADYDGDVRVDGERASGNGTAKANSLMVNAIYSFDGMGANAAVVPYLGAGLGAVQLDYEGEKSAWDFGYQVMAGVGYQVAPQWTLYGEGRWFATSDAKVWPGEGTATDISFGTFDLLLGVEYAF